MAITKEIVVSTKYTDKNGNEKTSYINIGRVFETDKGQSIKLDAIPVNWNGFANLYDPKPREAKEPAKANGYQSDDSDIPF